MPRRQSQSASANARARCVANDGASDASRPRAPSCVVKNADGWVDMREVYICYIYIRRLVVVGVASRRRRRAMRTTRGRQRGKKNIFIAGTFYVGRSDRIRRDDFWDTYIGLRVARVCADGHPRATRGGVGDAYTGVVCGRVWETRVYVVQPTGSRDARRRPSGDGARSPPMRDLGF
jgi:hypothetical protein